jgi:release factor glutamine methyltransferase
LKSAGVPYSGREARLLLAHVLHLDEARLIARPEMALPDTDHQRFAELVERRAAGEPSAYLLGRREFYGRAFAVDRRVLVPRPETEHLVEAALALDLPEDAIVLDVGTGSGCVAITLALERPAARTLATDRSAGALAVARHNAAALGARVHLVGADLASALDVDRLDLVVSNPPYIAESEIATLPVDVREHEPRAALLAGPTGLEAYTRLVAQLVDLRPGTPLAVEVGAAQAGRVQALFEGSGFRHERTLPDYAGIPRVVIGRRAPWTASTS